MMTAWLSEWMNNEMNEWLNERIDWMVIDGWYYNILSIFPILL